MESKAAFVVRDPVHGYLRVARHERVVVDHPITQRLRNIVQTGLAQMIYPEANTSRFVHSLGAMHLASRFLVGIVENSANDVVEQFFREMEAEAKELFPMFKWELLDDLLVHDAKMSGGLLATRLAFRSNQMPEERIRRRRLLGLTEAGLRLAALFHDLGHFPFSHDLELAFRMWMTRDPAGAEPFTLFQDEPPHEVIGHRLARLVLHSLLGRQSLAEVAAYKLAVKILDATPDYATLRDPHASALAWLHSLVDGEVDVDRADYLLRDGRALGFEFAAFDLERLIDQLVVTRTNESGYITAVREAGLGPLESFFLSRARSAQAMIRHHKNAQLGAALRHVSVDALAGADGARLRADIQELLQWSEGWEETVTRDLLRRFSQYDDAWWVTVLRKLTPAEPLAKACLDLVLLRAPVFRPAWKRKGDLPPESVQRLNVAVDRGWKQRGELTRQALEADQILLTTHRFQSFRLRPQPTGAAIQDESIVQVLTERRGLVPAARMSPLIKALASTWEEDPHAHAFVLEGRSHDGATIVDRLVASLTPAIATTLNG